MALGQQCVGSVKDCLSYLTVESEDPVTMTLSSYWRHNTEPVWPVSIFRHSRDCLSQIYEEKKTRVGRWAKQSERAISIDEDTEKEGEKNKQVVVKRLQIWVILRMAYSLSAVFMPHFPTAVLKLCGCTLVFSRTIRQIHSFPPSILPSSSSSSTLLSFPLRPDR